MTQFQARQVSRVRAMSWQQRSVRVGSFLVLGLFTLAYIGLTNHVATQGYKLSELQAEVQSSQRQLASLELDIAAAQSLPRVEAEAGSFALVPAVHIEYLATSGTSVAVR